MQCRSELLSDYKKVWCGIVLTTKIDIIKKHYLDTPHVLR